MENGPSHLEGLRVIATFWILCAHFSKSGGFRDPGSFFELIPGYDRPSESYPLDFLMSIFSRGRLLPVKMLAVLSGFLTHHESGAAIEAGSGAQLLQYYSKHLDRVLFTFYVTLSLSTVLLYHPLFGMPMVWALRDDGGGADGRAAVKSDLVWTFTLLRQWIPNDKRLAYDHTPMANAPCWFVISALPTWLLYPLLAAPLRLHAGRPSRSMFLLACALGIAFAQFQIARKTWDHMCFDLSNSHLVAPSGPSGVHWYAWEMHYHPLTFLSEFIIGALAAAALRNPRGDGAPPAQQQQPPPPQQQQPAGKGESQPLIGEPREPQPGEGGSGSRRSDVTPTSATAQPASMRHYCSTSFASDASLACAVALVVFLPRPHTYADTCSGAIDMGAIGPGTAAYGWDPLFHFAAPVINLLLAFYMYSTMRSASEAERGAGAAFLRLFAPVGPFCLAIYLWQVPFAYILFKGRPVNPELAPLLFFALLLWAYFYTEAIEKPCVGLIRSTFSAGCGTRFCWRLLRWSTDEPSARQQPLGEAPSEIDHESCKESQSDTEEARGVGAARTGPRGDGHYGTTP